MKRILLLSLCVTMLVFAGSADAFGQKKKKKKEKAPKMSKTEMVSTISNLQQQVADLTEKNNGLEADLSSARDEANAANQQLDEALAQVKTLERTTASTTATTGSTGLSFRIQIGAFNKISLAQYFNTPKIVTAESQNGVSKYLMGSFGSFDEARDFELALRKAGFKDAWLVPYNDGERISDDDAEGILGHPIRD